MATASVYTDLTALEGLVPQWCQLSVNDTPVSWALSFVTNGTVMDDMTTYDLRYTPSSPGHIVLAHMLRYAIERRMSRFVMGRGAQAYKYWHGAKPRATENLIVYANRPRGQAYVGVRALRERTVQAARFLMTHREKRGWQVRNGKNSLPHRF